MPHLEGSRIRRQSVGEGVKGESRRQTQGLVKASNKRSSVWETPFTFISRLINSDLGSSAGGYMNALSPSTTPKSPVPLSCPPLVENVAANSVGIRHCGFTWRDVEIHHWYR
jgi:hypothetical protein